MSDVVVRHADGWAATVLQALATEYPSAAGHLALGPDDTDVRPAWLHPAFWGCLDWHSSAHMQWSAVTLLASGHLSRPTADALVDVLNERLTTPNIEVEVDYLRAHPGFERPYGWGWAALLAASVCRVAEAPGPLSDPAARWATALRPLADVIVEHTLAWLPKQAYPVRSGVHDNTAFGLGLLFDAASAFGRHDVASAIGARARDWFGRDRDYPASWEPSGSDFLSAALCEADLMRRVLPTVEFAPWLTGFLPGLASDGDNLLTIPEVLDRTDGKIVHLVGLALSRAAMLRPLAPFVDADAAARIAAAAAAQVDSALPEIDAGDFMATHWLVSFALLAEGA